MRLHRFFVNEPLAGRRSFKIKDRELLHQLKHVFRFQIGHQLILLDNSGYEFHAQIAALSGIEAILEIVSSKISPTAPEIEFWLFMSLVKKDKFEWVLEKGTEIGVSHFLPLLADRSEKKNFNRERGEKIIKEATEQSLRARLPQLHEIMNIEEALGFVAVRAHGASAASSSSEKFEKIFVLDGTGGQKLEKGACATGSKIALFIGPEGGWSPRELALFKKQGVSICTLGPAMLRAETAAIVGASQLLL